MPYIYWITPSNISLGVSNWLFKWFGLKHCYSYFPLTNIIVKARPPLPRGRIRCWTDKKTNNPGHSLSHIKSVHAGGLHPVGGKCQPCSKLIGKNSYKNRSHACWKVWILYVIQKYDIPFNTQKFRFPSHIFQLSHVRAEKIWLCRHRNFFFPLFFIFIGSTSQSISFQV